MVTCYHREEISRNGDSLRVSHNHLPGMHDCLLSPTDATCKRSAHQRADVQGLILHRRRFAFLGAWCVFGGIALMDMRHPNNQHVGRAPLKKRVFVGATLQAKTRLELDQVSVRDAGQFILGVYGVSRACALEVFTEGTLGNSALKRQAGCVRGPGQAMLLSRGPRSVGGLACALPRIKVSGDLIFGDAEHVERTSHSLLIFFPQPTVVGSRR